MLLLSNLNIVLLIFYDAKITLNMYLHGITQTFQIHKLLPNCMMIVYILRLLRLQSQNLTTLMIEMSLSGKAGLDTFLQI